MQREEMNDMSLVLARVLSDCLQGGFPARLVVATIRASGEGLVTHVWRVPQGEAARRRVFS